ncbi:MAG: putative zinc-binding metallopeptidase [Brachymonas sp.]
MNLPTSTNTTRSAYRCVCGSPIFFRNSQCLSCGRALAYEPGSARMVALQVSGAQQLNAWLIEGDSNGQRYARCGNFKRAAGCNWLVALHAPLGSEHDEALCIACSLNRTIPDQSLPENELLWARIESAKRRLVSQLLGLGLPVQARKRNPQPGDPMGLAFDFLREWPGQSVTTGHASGVITVNVQEADDAERERIRAALHEPYRTLLGHLRHEVGHYYWERLVLHSEWLLPFRALFGDERTDYSAALHQHYTHGARPDWHQHHVSQYASSHPWEDWAETWAHYLHLRDALGSAQSFGFTGDDVEWHAQPFGPSALWDAQRAGSADYLKLINDWLRMTSVLNELSDSMGQAPFYPFALSAPVVAKLQFVHELIVQAATSRSDLHSV